MTVELRQVAATGARASSWKPYPAYKDSGVEWLGKVPDGWKVQKLKHIAKVNLSNVDKKTNEGEDTVKLCNYVDVYYNDYITPDLDFMEATASPEQIDKFALREGDVIITKDSESWEDIAVPAYIPADLKGVICGYHLAHIRPNYSDIYGEYLFWSLCVPRLNHQFRIEAHGITRFGIGKYGIDNSLFLMPPINAQKFIARFLDDRTRKIDSLIEKKQKMIELLKEERAAVINQAVTKGLNPDAPMKDSGIEWLGEVPEHWNIVRLKLISKIKYGLGEPPKQKEDGIPLIRATNIDRGKIIEKDLVLVDPKDVPYERDPVLKKDDIIVVRSGAYTADSAIIPQKYDGAIAGYDMVVRVVKATPKYIAFALLSQYILKNQLYLQRMRAAQPHLNAEELGDTLILIPPINEEQQAIIQLIEYESAKIDSTISIIEKELLLLQEYRTALISEVVTGKIDVRETT